MVLWYTYSRLPESFKENIKPVPVKNPELVVLNKSLAEKLNLNFSTLNDKEISELFSGNSLPPESNSIAQAWAILLLSGGSELPLNNSEISLSFKVEKFKFSFSARLLFNTTNSGFFTGTGFIFSLNDSGNLE